MKNMNELIRKMGSESDNLERTVISTYGSFIADSLIEWTKVNILNDFCVILNTSCL